jgi:hypothetical protein
MIEAMLYNIGQLQADCREISSLDFRRVEKVITKQGQDITTKLDGINQDYKYVVSIVDLLFKH